MREVGITLGVLLLLGLGAWFALTLFDDDTLEAVDPHSQAERDPNAGLVGRRPSVDARPTHVASPATTEEVDGAVVVGGASPGDEDVRVRVVDPAGRGLFKARWDVRDARTRKRVHASDVVHGDAWTPADRVPSSAHVTIIPAASLRARGLLSVTLYDVDLRSLGTIRVAEGRLIQGVIRDASGLEEEGVLVRSLPPRTGEGRLDGHGMSARTDLDGRYRVFVPDGVAVRMDAISNRLDRPVVSKTLVPGDERLDFVLPPEATLSVEVTDDRGTPVKGIRVSAAISFDTEDGRRTVEREDWTGKGGLAACPSLPPDAIVDLEVEMSSGTEPFLSQRIGGIRASEGTVRVRLERGLAIAGRVKAEDGGTGLVTVSATSLDGDERRVRSVSFPADGLEAGREFRILGLAPGRYRVMASGSLLEGWGSSELVVVDAGARGLELTVPRSYALEATFDGGDASGLRACWFAPTLLEQKSVGRSRIWLGGLPQGRGVLYVGRAGDPRYAWLETEASAGDLGRIQLKRGKWISIVVKGMTPAMEEDEGIPYAVYPDIQVRVVGTAFTIEVPGARAGRFHSYALPAGVYRVELWNGEADRLIDSQDGVHPGTEIVLRYTP